MISIYIRDCGERQSNQTTLPGRAVRLLGWWAGKTLADVSVATCRGYVEHRKEEYLLRYRQSNAISPPKENGGAGGAARDLEDLRAAIEHHAKEGLHRGEIRVTLPEKGAPRERWLTRDEAAKLLWCCWRTKMVRRQSNRSDYKRYAPFKDQYPLRHLARFILIGLYTGSRAGAIASASWAAASDRAYIDLERGVFYRRRPSAKITNKRQPPAPLPERLVAHIRRWKDLGIAKQFPVEFRGKPVKSVKVALARAVNLAGLEGNITPHTLRHTAATWLMQAGVPIWEAAGFLGMSVDVLEKVYGHHHPDHMRGAANALNVGANKTPMKSVNQRRTRVGG